MKRCLNYWDSMKKIMIIFLLVSGVSPLFSTDMSMCLDHDSRTFFAEKPHKALYWKVLLKVAHNKKSEALALVEALVSNKIDDYSYEHEKEVTSLDDFFDLLFLAHVIDNPQKLSELGLFESIGIREHNEYLTDYSPEALLRRVHKKRLFLEDLESVSLEGLSSEQKKSCKIFHWMLTQAVRGEKFLFHDYVINHMSGILTELDFVFTQFHRLEIPEDVTHYIERLARIPQQIHQIIELLAYQKKHGIRYPACVLVKTLKTLEAWLSEDSAKNPFFRHLAQSIKTMQHIDRDDELYAAAMVIEERVYPAFRLLHEYCKQLYRESGDRNHGAYALPDGDAYYAHLLKDHTTTHLSADEIHELGLHEVRVIEKKIRMLLSDEGIINPSKSVGELIQELSQDSRFFYSSDEEGREQCHARFEAILDRSRKTLSHLFDIKPTMPVKIQVAPFGQEAISIPYYLPPSIDGSRPGVFVINLEDMRQIPIYSMESTTIHESEPGHHFQIALQQEMDIPILRKMGGYNAYVEGWALYAEKLAYEEKFYSSSWAKLGHLQWDLIRAARLVVDTGIHKKRWSYDEAVAYMTRTTGLPHGTIIAEVERYFAFPAQACSYKIGQLKILELRQRALDALGDHFDIRKFHDVVLQLGAAPLAVLEEVVDQYIEETLSLRMVNTRKEEISCH